MKTQANHTWWGRFAAIATFALVSFFALPASAALQPASVTMSGSSVTKTVLPDQSTVVKFLADGTLTLPDGATGRILLVGGGGAGGRDCSGGGGAGGMLEGSNVLFAAGTYTVTVGAGGQPYPSNSSVPGGNGGDTVLTFAGVDRFTAVGGGGGGSWGHVDAAAGGSGGGATSNGTGGSGVEGQGYAGGSADNRAPAGGGGAGGVGAHGTNGNGPGTAGGPGRASDITGETVYYAGGGGGGGFNYADAPVDNTWRLFNGGIGGGGNGARNVSIATRQATTLPDGRNEYDAEAGVDGLGGGGGGANNSDYVGRPGGSGVLIVRLDPVAAGPEPQIVVSGVVDGERSAVVNAYLVSVGDNGSSATVSYVYATSISGLATATTNVAATGVAAGTPVPISLTGLPGGKTVYIRVFAVNDQGVAAAPVDATAHPIAGFDRSSFDLFATFAVTGYAGADPLTNFPVLVRISENSPAGFSYADCAADGSDLRFADAAGNLVPHEADTWNPAGESLLWVRVPVVTNGAEFAMYYASSEPGVLSSEDVWSRYAVVIHGGSAIGNSVAGGPAVTVGNTTYVKPNADAGRIGGGIRKSANNGTGNAVAVNVAMGTTTDSTTLEDTGKFTVSGWFKRNGNGGNDNGTHVLAGSRSSWGGNAGFLWLQEVGNYISVAAAGSHQFSDSANGYKLADQTWGHLAFAYEKDTSLTTWFDGALDNQKTSGVGNLVCSDGTWTFGSYANTGSNDSFIGDMDELRVFDGVASGDWIAAERDTVVNASFLSADAVQDTDPDAPRIAAPAAVEGILRIDVSFACSMSGATATYRLAAAGEDPDEATPVVVSSSTTADATISVPLTGLVGNTAYTIVLEAEKDGHASRPVTLVATPFALDPAFTPDVPAHDARSRVGADEVHVLSASGTFTLATGRRVRLLAVGGGGGAGWGSQWGGAGGGAGGMVEVSNLVLKAGTYRYVVGAGGAGRPGGDDANKGGNGGDTLLYWIDPSTYAEVLVASAAGGGGSGSVNDGWRDGLDGGSGGGAVFWELNYSRWGRAGQGIAGQGHAGGGWTNSPGSVVGASGGGGAGAPGQAGSATKGGDGGDGRPSDITGEEVWYAGGGGGSARNNDSNVRTIGQGGKGGGGHGADYGDYAPDPGRDGVDGLGGGGGGGLAWFIQGGPHRWFDCKGGNGGSGTLILRFAAAPSDEPVLADVTATLKDATTVTFAGTVEWVGDGASTADVRLTQGGMVFVAAQGLATGDAFTFDVPVTPGATFAWSLALRNDLNENSASVSGSIEVPANDPVAITTTGASETRTVGIDTVAIFTNTAAAGSFTVPAGGAWVEMLVVGGGGAGGLYWDYFGGAGGGAGGFVHEPAHFLEAGTYTVTVGAGGQGREDEVWDGHSWPGRPGSPSAVQLGGVDVVRAFGGSGGASRYSGNCTNSYAGSPQFASTGGAMPMNTSNIGYLRMHAQPGTPGQGNPGGWGDKGIVTNASGASEHHFAGGGGGAGAPGGDGSFASGTVGAGGDGLPCSITGEEVWYAGGGGAGADYKGNGSWIAEAGKGGKGGGGYGQRWKDATDPDNRGVNGLGGGGGGGGGSRGNQNNASDTASGHAGGSGTVIVRWRSMAESTILVACDAPVGGFRRGTFSGTVTAAGGAGATVAVEIGVSVAGSATTNWTTVATGLKAGDSFSAAVDGLADNRTYVAAWRASNVFASATGDAGSFTTYAGAYLVPGASDGATVTTVGNDSVYTYSNSAAAGTFTVATPGYARILLAGGGGAGGWARGGGGGGGGVIEEELVWLEAGTYTVEVGAGGASPTGNGMRGGNGGDTVVSLGGIERWRAYGGGGGGTWNDNGVLNLGADGGSGGGSARRREFTAGNPIDPAQGHAGAPSRRRDLGNMEDYWSAGGGGGAGSAGVQASADHTVAGAGGAGRTSDISGTAQQYGAGGGASCTSLDTYAAGEGGDGIGGHGRRTSNTQYWVGDEPGRAGYGGGGGGGGDSNQNNNFIYAGAPGGCGTVIIRFANATPARPDATVVAAAPSAADPAGADVEIMVRSLGGAASATLELAYGASAGSLPLRQTVGTVTAAGTVDALLSGLEPGKTYYVAAAISTAAGETVSRAVPVTIPVANAEAGAAGLWQTVWGTTLPATDAEVWARASSSNVVAGAIAAIGTGASVDPFSGDTYSWGSAPQHFVYKGVIFLKGGTTYTFGSQMDDTVRLAIGGTTLIDLEASPSTTSFADFTAPWTGWYPIEIRLGNAVGDRTKHGPDGDGQNTWANFALAFNTEGSRSMIPDSAWTTLLDPGDGSFLRPADPGLRYADVTAGAVADGSLPLAVSVAPGDAAVEAYLCYGAAWGGDDPVDWDEADYIDDVAAAGTVTSLAAQTVAGWGTTAKVAAVALVHPDGTVTMSAPVTYAGTSLLSLSAAATDWSQGDELEVSYTVAGGSAPYRAELWVGNGPGSLSKVATGTLSAAGTGTLRATGLTPSATYYWQVVVKDASGASASSDPSANVTMPGAAEILNTSSGISWSLDQRTATLKGNLKTLGAGDNWAYLYVTDRLYERWPGDTRAFRGSTTNTEIKVQLTQTGPFSITHTFDWNQEIGFSWVLSNSNGRVTWVGSRKPDWNGNDAAAQAHFWTGDYQTYTWNGGSGVWNDTTMWTGDGTMEGHEQAGYPVTGSYFTFPAGTHEVTIPAGGDKVELGVPMFRPTSFYLQKNAKVTLKATPASAALQLTQTDYPLRQRTIDIPEGAELVVSGVKGRWWTVRDNWTGFYFNGPNTLLEFTDGAEIDMGNGYGAWGISSWNDGSKVGRRFVVSNGAKLTLRGRLMIAGPQTLTIDDGQLWMQDSTWYDDNTIDFAFTEGGGVVFRGAHPLLVANRRIWADTGNNPNGDALQFFDFEIPVAGFAEAPLRTRPDNTTYQFGNGGNADRRLVMRVPTNAPAATAKVVLDQPIIWWPAGTNECVLIDDAYLPHPDTDYWYETFDDLTGAFTGYGVHIVGRPASEAPQVVGLTLTNVVEGAAGFEFYGIPGDNAASATFSAAIERTDVPADATASVALVGGPSVAQGTRFAIAATGLAQGGTYRVTVTGVDPADGSLTCTETIVFDALRDYVEANASADAVVTQDGPYTVWTFTNTAAASTFTLSRPGTARILVVGGGGSGGGSDRTDENEGETRRGGGGGAGGEVVDTELYLQAGEYTVVVGAGGAGTGGYEVGKQGGWSTFGYLATAYGGGGGGAWAERNRTWAAYVDSGANGGGAAGNGTTGGAVTSASGHTGGAGSYNSWANWTDRYAGGGGGSTAAVGGDAGLDEFNMFVPGDGADGVLSDITGSPVYYGGGGGGGCAGLRFGAGHGGHGGKGGGGEGRAWRDVSVFATEAAKGVDGLGGGGGGGSACRISSADASLQSYCGGKGGSGVVIVRMLTSTLETADPVVQLRSAEPTPGGVDLDFDVHSFGGAAAEAGLFFAWGANGTLSNTNDLGSVAAAGAVSRAITGLKPGTTYSGALVATNAAGGATVVDLGTFRTATESHADADSGVVAGTWTLSPWLENDVSAFSDNLLRTSNGGFANFNQNRYKNGEWGVAPGGSNRGGWERDLIDGVMNRTDGRYVGYGTNNLVVFTMAEQSALTSIRIFAGWGANDGWTPIAIEGIDVRSGANEEWTTLANSAYQQESRTGTWGEYATLEAGGNDWLARDARQIRVRFDKNLLGNHDGTMYWEIEAQGAAETDAPALHARTGRGRALAPTSTIRTATAVAAVVTAAAGAPAFDEVWAVWGPTYAGEETNAWAHARLLGSAGEAATSLALSISGGELDDAVYLRYCGVGADGTVSWSDSVYVPELAVQADVPPVVVFGTASSAGANATIEATVVSAGSLATVQAVDVTLQYTLDPTGFHEGGSYETFAFADNAAVGAIAPVTVSPLRAERRYYARFVSENDASQVGTSDVFTFDTAAGSGGGTLPGQPGLIQAKFTTGQEDRDSSIENAPAADKTVAIGTIMANTTADAADVDGNTWSWGANVNFGYVGYMRMEAGTTYTFGKQVDDWTYVKINGTVLLDNNAWSSFMTCDYTATVTGWVPVEFRFGNGSGGAGVSQSARWGFAYNTEGNKDWGTFQAGNSPWTPVLDPGDGSLLRVGAVRSLAVSRAEATVSSVNVSATLSPGLPNAGSVVAVWGASDLGDAAAVSAWAGSATVQAVTLGDEVPVSGTVSFDTVAYPIMRLAFVPTDTTQDTVWSAPVLLDAANPTIGPVSAATDGDRLTVSGSMASLGTGTGFSLTLVWGYTEDLAGATSTNLTLGVDDTFSATVPVVPSTNGWWCLVARTTDGGCDATLPAAFETKGASVLKGLASATVSHHDITATGTLDVLGAGTTTVTLWAGSDENSLEPVSGSSKVLSTAGSFTVTGTVPGDPHLVYWKIVSVNVAPGGSTWTSESPVYTITTEDAATYTWKAEKTEGDWDDPANWTVSGVKDANDVLGYPDNAKAKVRFVANTTAVIAVDRSFVFQDMSIKAAGLQVTFAGTNAAVCRLEGDIMNTDENNDWTNLSGVRVVVSGVEFYDTTGHFNWSTRVSADTTLRLENGAVLSIGGNNGWVHHFGTNSWVEAVGGSRIVWRSLGDNTSAGFDLCGYGSGLNIEDSRMDVPYVIPQRYVTEPGEDQVIRLAGASAQLRVYAYFRTWSDTQDAMTNNVQVSYVVPVDGFEQIPLYAEYAGGADNRKFAWRSPSAYNGGRIVFSVDKDSPLLKSGRRRTGIQLMQWRAGIDTKSVKLTDRKGVHMYYTYGFPQTRKEPTDENEIPTGIAADITGQGTTILVIN